MYSAVYEFNTFTSVYFEKDEMLFCAGNVLGTVTGIMKVYTHH